MIVRVTDYDAVDRNEADFEHWYCCELCAEAGGWQPDAFDDVDEKELIQQLTESDTCEMCDGPLLRPDKERGA